MSGQALYDFGGLVTAPGLLARNPASCVDCNNVTFPIAGVMRKRKGFEIHSSYAMSAILPTEDRVLGLFTFKAAGTFVYVKDTLYDNQLRLGATTLTTTLSSSELAAKYARMFALGDSYYLTAARSNVRIDQNAPTSFVSAGMPPGLAPTTYSMNAAVYSVLSGTPGFVVADGSNVAYRVTWHRKTVSQNYELGGPPSSRLIIRNITGTSGYAAGVTKNVNLRIPLPFEVGSQTGKVTADYFWRLWRSHSMATDTADDEMYLIDEAFVTAANIAVGYAVVSDVTPDGALQGAPRLHTNSVNFPPGGAGLLNGQAFADAQPPGASDAVVFANCAWYARPYWNAFQQLQLVTLPAVNDTLTVLISGIPVVLKCVAGAPANPGEFTLVNGLGTLSLNIEATARNIVDAYVRASTVGGRCYYLSQGTQQAGIIAFEAGAGAHSIKLTPLNAGVGALFRPVIPAAGQTINPVSKTNVVVFSKEGRADAVPPCNQMTVGPSDNKIVRLMPFRDRLLCWTEAGLYEISGTDYSNFSASIVDATKHICAALTPVVCEDRAYAWCLEGIVEVSDGGPIVISTPIEPTIQAVISSVGGFTSSIDDYESMFAIADTNNHCVMFFYGNGAGPPACRQWLQWEARARKWSKGSLPSSGAYSLFVLCGALQKTTGLVMLGEYGDVYNDTLHVFVQRSAWTSADFQDVMSNGAVVPIDSSATFQFQVPGVDTRQHWQQLLAHFENAEQTFYPKPTSIGLKWESDTTAISSATTVTLATPIIRAETPGLYRRSTRQRVTVSHALAEHFGLLVLEQSYADAKARFPK